MALEVVEGNIFRSSCQTIVNTVNCAGVMGRGLAFECRLRFPQMYERYVQLCEQKRMDVGLLWLCKTTTPWVLNFPTKTDWRLPSKPEYLHRGLQKFMVTYQAMGIVSAAFPLLGAQNGGLTPRQSLALMRSYLEHCTTPVEIYRHDASAPDDLYDAFKSRMLDTPIEAIRAQTGLRADAIARVRDAVHAPDICQLNQLLQVKGIGEKTLEKCFALAMATPSHRPTQAPSQGGFEF